MITNRFKITISPNRLHSSSSLQRGFPVLLLDLSPCYLHHDVAVTSERRCVFAGYKLHSASLINSLGASNDNIFWNRRRIRLSPIKSSVLKKYKNSYKRSSIYFTISNRNAKSCICCKHLNYQSTITPTVNNRRFSVVNNSDLDWKSEDVIYVSTSRREAEGCKRLGRPTGP